MLVVDSGVWTTGSRIRERKRLKELRLGRLAMFRRCSTRRERSLLEAWHTALSSADSAFTAEQNKGYVLRRMREFIRMRYSFY